ncbi:MAG: Pr6Pr family membrane protein [Treponema sp.]|nr:Pr6Pr family membrane protein [Treponema sp.]
MEILKIDGREIVRIFINIFTIICAGTGVTLAALKMGFAPAISYFTIQSNLLCLAASVITIILEIKKSGFKIQGYHFFRGMALVSILLTFFIYNFVLRPALIMNNADISESLESILLHVVVPVLMFGDFLFFEAKGYYKIWYPFGWVGFPVFYIVYTVIYRAFGGVYRFFSDAPASFPYFFLNYETYGFKKVGLWLLLIMLGFIGFSYILIGLGNLIKKISDNAAG